MATTTGAPDTAAEATGATNTTASAKAAQPAAIEPAASAAPGAAPSVAPPSPAATLRTGLGIDVHAFAPAEAHRRLVLGGVDIPYERGLAGHSDADVLAHAIADALLGAARLGDIGKLFPDTDPTFKDADSLVLLAQACQAVRGAGFDILDIDSVICCQEPKLSPHRDAMRRNIARAASLDVDNVGIKATTTERLGFEGRSEGISAYATCLLQRKDA